MTELTWQRKIGEILLERDVVTAKQLEEALKIQEMILKPIGKILIDMEVTTEEQIAEALAEQRGCTRITIKEYKINKQAVKLFPMPMARLHKALPIDFDGEEIVLAMADPLDVYAIDDVRMITGREVKPMVCTESEILSVIDEYLAGVVHPVEEDITEILKEQVEEVKKTAADNMPAFVDAVIELAAENGISGICFEPQENLSNLRLRLHGDLYDFMTVKKEDHAALAAHLRKALNMGKKGKNFVKLRKKMRIGKSRLDLEAILLPTVFGEDVCVRILNSEIEPEELKDLGLRWNALTNVRNAFANRSGLILGIQVPNSNHTGEDITSLFHAMLRILTSSQKRVFAVESKAMEKIKGVVQVETHPEKEPSLKQAPVLAAVCNSDPEVIMVNDIEDKESACLLVKAALNSTLVLSVLEGENVLSGFKRLVELGAHPLLVAESIKCIILQKNAKRLCPSCKKNFQPKPEMLTMLSDKAGFEIGTREEQRFFTADGCGDCSDSGFCGTIGIFQVVPVSDALRSSLVRGDSAEQIQKIAEEEGAVSLKLDAYYKSLQGDISFEEFVKQLG